ncbi:LuxR C-terminal-related transcriptional regulator [Luteimonas fraxinea]|nr:LuxR C-terminal-related transcriptional regulator [Luteimonas fraxinea]UHH11645.1 LuxR C-terminal-related transcriptional regulator [Luteimonas fraxinea]
MLFSFMDLEPRRKAEDALRQSEERFAKAFQMTPVPTLVCSADALRVMEVNEAFVTTTGLASEELLGKSLDETGLFEDRAAHTRIQDALRDSGVLRSTELRIHRKQGELLDCLLSAESLTLHGQPCHLMALLDITDRKRSEMELVGAIETVMQDASWFSQTLIEKLANVRRGNAPGAEAVALADLTARERDALGLMCEGLSDKEIATRLGLATNTVRNHVASLYSKIDVHSRAEAIVWARERGYFGSGSSSQKSG